MLETLVRNWPLKLLSLSLAFAMWVAVTRVGVVIQDLTVPVSIALENDFTLVGAKPTTGTVRLRGPETLLREVDRLGMELRVDLGETSPGERTVQLRSEHLVGLPRGVDVTQITPDRFTLEVDWRDRRTLPVVPSLLDQPPEGYTLYGASVRPNNLTVEGPRSEVQALTRLRSDPISLEGRTEPFVVRVAAIPESPEVRVLGTDLLDVRVDVDADPTEATVEGVPVVITGQVFESAATPSTLDVVLAGPPALLGGIRSQQLRAVVSVADLAPRVEPYSLPPRVEFVDVAASDLPRITVISSDRDSVAVRVSDRRISE